MYTFCQLSSIIKGISVNFILFKYESGQRWLRFACTLLWKKVLFDSTSTLHHYFLPLILNFKRVCVTFELYTYSSYTGEYVNFFQLYTFYPCSGEKCTWNRFSGSSFLDHPKDFEAYRSISLIKTVLLIPILAYFMTFNVMCHVSWNVINAILWQFMTHDTWHKMT